MMYSLATNQGDTVVRALWKWVWEDLGYEEPHPARCLLYVGAAALLGLVVWVAVIGILALA